jgi:ABC-type transport system involved in cytochrome c biogenesis permease subunit
MGVSCFFGAFMAEKAERERHLKDMEEATKIVWTQYIMTLPDLWFIMWR